MNRKERRASRSRGAGPALGSAAHTPPAETLADLMGTAMARHQAGALIEAEHHYRHILTLFPAHAETHGMLGAALMAQGKSDEAISHFERVIAIKPALPGAYENLAKAYMTAGRPELAIDPASRALELSETAQCKIFFAQCVQSVRFAADNGRFRKLVLRALLEAWAAPRQLAGVCISLIKLNGAVNNGAARANAAWPARLPAMELCGASGMTALSRDELLLALLECDPVTDIDLERLLTNLRHIVLTACTADGPTDEHLEEHRLRLYCAVARQCFINQYVFSLTQAEADDVLRLRASLEKALASDKPSSLLNLVAAAAYFPLHTLANAEVLLARSWPECVAALIVQQVEEPAQEREIAATIPVLTPVSGDVSDRVRQQYEESPYPRWVKAGPPAQAAQPDSQPQQRLDVLIAGCGTGLSTIEFALQAPQARIAAVDLSLASLSYAQRMARKFGVANIEFGQADIMELTSFERTFDLIDVSGVLHHLADPWQGWRLLLSLLRPGGTMQVGLYSQLARQNIVAARALIAERGYRPIPDDIRRCREDIIAAPEGSLLKSVTRWEDFFTTNECRDLLFHVQEHRITLREIKSFLAANNVQFTGFLLDAATRRRFATRYPDPAAMTDLDRWHDFETAAPGTFTAMYQFWIRKPAERST
jgi:SAM-dependent methyltransferase/Tfp pilus assembly protein PilF